MGVGMVTGPFRSLPLLGAEFLSVPNWGWSWGMGVASTNMVPDGSIWLLHPRSLIMVDQL